MKLAIICGGKPQLNRETPLQYIGGSIDRVVEILETNGWKCIPFKEATDNNDYKELLSNYNIEDISEFLFYYIGHGKGNNLTTFEIILNNTNWTLEQIKLRTKEAFGNLPRKMAIVLDACYSGNAINKTDRIGDTELLTSSNRNSQTFEKIMPDGKGWSEFSYYFYNAFNSSYENDSLNLEQIGKYITHEKQMGRDTYYLPNPSQQTDKIIIGYVKELNEIRDILKGHYDNDVKELKDDFLTYLLQDALSFKEISNCDNMDSLIQHLFKEKECLYCILKDINPEYVELYKHILKKKTNCKERKGGDGLAKIVFIIGNKEIEDNEQLKYDFESYSVTKKNEVRLEYNEEKVDFSKKSEYTSTIGKLIEFIISKYERLGQTPQKPPEIIFILPEKLHNKNFLKLPYKNKTIAEKFPISIKFEKRYDLIFSNYTFIEIWKNKSCLYRSYLDRSIEINQELHMCDYEIEGDNFGLIYSLSDSFICLLSQTNLLSYVDELLEFGIIMASFPRQNKSKKFEETCTMNELKKKLIIHNIRNGNNYYFLYDIYHETKELKEQITQIKPQEVNQQFDYI